MHTDIWAVITGELLYRFCVFPVFY